MPDLRPTAMSLPGVLVAADLVGSSGFRAHRGRLTSLALAADAQDWVRVSEADSRPTVTARAAGPDSAAELLLTGIVLPFTRPCVLGGWVLDVGGVPVHVDDVRSGPAVPAPGTWVRMRGAVSVADDYEVTEVEEALQRPMERPWLVHRIVRLLRVGDDRRTFRAQPAESIRHTGDTSSYLVDLVAADGPSA